MTTGESDEQTPPHRQVIDDRAREIGTNLKALSLKLGLNQAYLQQYVKMGKPKKLDGDLRKQLAKLLKFDETRLIDGDSTPLPGQDSALNPPHNPGDTDQLVSNVSGKPREVVPDASWRNGEMVNVMGTGQGGDGSGFFEWNGEVIDQVKRPPKLYGRQRIFAIYLSGESMYPALRNGALLYIDAVKKPMIGRDVLIELHPKRPGDAPMALVKRVVAMTGEALKVEQFNPARTFTFKRAEIKNAYLVLETEDLFG